MTRAKVWLTSGWCVVAPDAWPKHFLPWRYRPQRPDHQLRRLVQHRHLTTSLVGDVKLFYRDVPAMHEQDAVQEGFEWVDCSDAPQGVVSFLRIGKLGDDPVLAVFNFTPVPRPNYRIGVPFAGRWEEALNSDATTYGGAGWGNYGSVVAEEMEQHGRPFSLPLALPPLSVMFFRRNPDDLARSRAEAAASMEGEPEAHPANIEDVPEAGDEPLVVEVDTGGAGPEPQAAAPTSEDPTAV